MEASQVSVKVPAGREFMCYKCGIEIPPECKKDDSANFVDPQSSKAINQKEDIDWVLCEDCMDSVLEGLKGDVAAANNELSQYTEALFELERDRRNGCFSEDENEGKALLLQEQEKQLSLDLVNLEMEERFIREDLDSLLAEEARLDMEISRLRDDSISLTRAIIDSEESIESVNRKLRYCQSTLRKLKRMSILKEAFFIHHEGQGFASVNGLRIGRPAVLWTEVNAALGFLCLLVDVLTKQLSITLTQYRVLPRGSFSVLIRKSDKSALELYADESSGGIGRFLTGRKFDAAMTAFLQIISEIVSHIQQDHPDMRISFPIEENEGKVGGLSVGLQFNSEENWSKAMKMLLDNIKCVVDYVESVY